MDEDIIYLLTFQQKPTTVNRPMVTRGQGSGGGGAQSSSRKGVATRLPLDAIDFLPDTNFFAAWRHKAKFEL